MASTGHRVQMSSLLVECETGNPFTKSASCSLAFGRRLPWATIVLWRHMLSMLRHNREKKAAANGQFVNATSQARLLHSSELPTERCWASAVGEGSRKCSCDEKRLWVWSMVAAGSRNVDLMCLPRDVWNI